MAKSERDEVTGSMAELVATMSAMVEALGWTRKSLIDEGFSESEAGAICVAMVQSSKKNEDQD